MKVRFIGALGTVAGSCTLMNHRDRYYLVDCGIAQGSEAAVAQNKSPFEFKPSGIWSVFLTHAHMDHCGLLPKLVKEGFRGKIYCTRATADLTVQALRDAARLDESLFSAEDVDRLVFFCFDDDEQQFAFGRFSKKLDEDLTFSLIRTSHVLGAVAFEFQFADERQRRQTIVFSGDIGNNTDGNCYQPLLNGRQYPSTHAEYIVCESTYGARVRESRFMDFEKRIEALKGAVMQAAKRGSKPTLIFPCFTLHRTQELVADFFYLFERHLNDEDAAVLRLGGNLPLLLVDSPLASNYGVVFARELSRKRPNGKPYYLNPFFKIRFCKPGESEAQVLERLLAPDMPLREFANFALAAQADRSFKAAESLRIIVAGSGMCNGGRVERHLKEHLGSEGATVMLTGYQGRGTPGAELMERASNPEAEICGDRWGLESDEIQAAIVDLSPFYSGHADQSGLLDFLLRKDNPKHHYSTLKRVFLVHGDNDSRAGLKEEIESRQATTDSEERKVTCVEMPVSGQGWFDLTKNDWVNEYHPKVDCLEIAVLSLTRRVEQLESLLAQQSGKRVR